ncbi:MAG: hypothetical protein KBT02_05715 [Treponema sp.]|nr:hypothetical protein [Candidatus Treponema caballi]
MNSMTFNGWTVSTYDDIPAACADCTGIPEKEDQERISENDPMLRIVASRDYVGHTAKIYLDYGWAVHPDGTGRHILTIDDQWVQVEESAILLMAYADRVCTVDNEECREEYVSRCKDGELQTVAFLDDVM